jgi:hypothetical protein
MTIAESLTKSRRRRIIKLALIKSLREGRWRRMVKLMMT